jgi:hypothetical protein
MSYGILDPSYQIKETSAGFMHQLFDFPQLTALDDNYGIFCVESYIRDLSDIRISMFTTKDDTEYYHDYLCDRYGIH